MAFQAVEFIVIAVVATLSFALHFAYGLAKCPQAGIVGVRLKAAFVGEREHLVVHFRGIAYAQHIHATVHQSLANPVNSHIALRAHHHLIFTAQRLENSLHQRGGFAGAWRAMHNRHIFSQQHLVHGVLLRGVEPWETHRGKGEFLRFGRVVEDVAQMRQAVALGTHHTLQRVHHQAIGGFVERELHAHLIRALQLRHAPGVGDCHHHALCFGITHCGRKRKVADFVVRVDVEKHHLSAKLEVVFHIGVGGAKHLHHQLVERVVVGAANAKRQPAVATLHFAPHAQRFGLSAKLFLFGVILHLQQRTLLLEQ